jgi:magnesium chelatase subunit D
MNKQQHHPPPPQSRRQHYPFAAIIGQEDLKLCLILCAIDPGIGGVLIKGDKGTAKSTAARGIAHLMSHIQVGYDSVKGVLDPYNRCHRAADTSSSSSTSTEQDEEDHLQYNQSKSIPTPFVDLPLGATEDRVVGSIDFSSTLKNGGKPIFSPGLLASANRGILYIDEVNLLSAHLVDVILDAAAMGVNTVQREGMMKVHPAKFMLIGTMNPEEGELRPQLLDRFGLMVDVAAPTDVEERCEVVRQRMQYERYPVEFAAAWADAEKDLTEQIKAAQERLPNVILNDELLLLISKICTEFKVGSLRADLTMYKAACALAAYRGRLEVVPEDVKDVTEWVLAHRRRRQPFESPMDGPSMDDLLDELMNSLPENSNNQSEGDHDEPNQQNGEDNKSTTEGSSNNNGKDDATTEDETSPDDNGQSSKQNEQNTNNDDGNRSNNDDQMQTFTASKPGQIKQLRLNQKQSGQTGSGRRNSSTNSQQKTRYTRSAPTDKAVDLALDATLRAAASNGLSDDGQLIIHPENYRKKVYNSTTDTLILFVVDASGSMSARKRMETVKGAVISLLMDAYQQRDKVGVIAFRGTKAEVLLEPTRSVELAEKQLQRLPTGGRTPLAHALSLTSDMIHRLQRHEPDQALLLIVLSDGKANVPLPKIATDSTDVDVGDAWKQTEQMAAQLGQLDVPTLLLDTDSGHVRVGRGKELSHLLRADYLLLEDMTADGLVHTIRQAAG